MIKEVTIDKVKKDLSSLGPFFDEIGAIGITGSLARGDFGERSDIDVFIVVDDQRFSKELEEIWYERLYRALKGYWRDLTLFIYPIGSLRGVSSWAVLNLASESLILFDKINLRGLFKEILSKAKELGLVQKSCGRHPMWIMDRDIKPGEEIIFRLEGEEGWRN